MTPTELLTPDGTLLGDWVPVDTLIALARESANGPDSRYAYDDAGRLTAVMLLDGTTSRVAYNGLVRQSS